jgi:hypothetical protein
MPARPADIQLSYVDKAMGCFLIGVTGKGWSLTGEALLGSVSDDPYDVRTTLRIVRPIGEQGHIGTELVSTTEHTLAERGYFARPGETTRGLNAAGLAFTCAMVFETEPELRLREPSPFADLTEIMMNTCERVADAISLFKSAGMVAPPYTILLADAKGELAQLEVGRHGVEVVKCHSRERPGAVFSVNCYQTPSLMRYNTSDSQLANPGNNNSARLERGTHLAETQKPSVNVGSLARLLSDHHNGDRDPQDNPLLDAWGYSICNHGTRRTASYQHEQLPWGTVSAEILQPAEMMFWYNFGWPCGSVPEYGDQIFQGHSWGRFMPFHLSTTSNRDRAIIQLTTAAGDITPDGARHLALSKANDSGN